MKRSAPDTLAWYAENAGRFFDDTVAVDLTPLHERFLALVPAGGHILDAGCGSGRDSRVFLERGYRVSAFDASPQLAGLASKHLGQAVATRTFDDVDEVACYDGIWACASLLHLAATDIPGALQRLLVALKPGGALYLSFKLGEGERTHAGRHFTDATEARLRAWLDGIPTVAALECWTTPDHRLGRTETWLAGVPRKVTSPQFHPGGHGSPRAPQDRQLPDPGLRLSQTMAEWRDRHLFFRRTFPRGLQALSLALPR